MVLRHSLTSTTSTYQFCDVGAGGAPDRLASWDHSRIPPDLRYLAYCAALKGLNGSELSRAYKATKAAYQQVTLLMCHL
jgi:hypothetical protein